MSLSWHARFVAEGATSLLPPRLNLHGKVYSVGIELEEERFRRLTILQKRGHILSRMIQQRYGACRIMSMMEVRTCRAVMLVETADAHGAHRGDTLCLESASNGQ